MQAAPRRCNAFRPGPGSPVLARPSPRFHRRQEMGSAEWAVSGGRHSLRRVPPVSGRWGMEEFVEARVQRLVADCLGVGIEELVSEVSLRDDLAADSLDLVELAMALEAEFGIVVPERILDRVRTYGDLVRATGLLIRARRAAEVRAAEPPLRMWTRVLRPAGESGGSLERAGWLTPYAAETIAEDAGRAGHGARRELAVAASSDDVGPACVQGQSE